MADMQLRQKLKKVMDVAEYGEQIPEQPKKIGFLIFKVFAIIGLLGLIILIIAMAIHGYLIGSLVVLFVTGLLTYAFYKLVTAEEIKIS